MFLFFCGIIGMAMIPLLLVFGIMDLYRDIKIDKSKKSID